MFGIFHVSNCSNMFLFYTADIRHPFGGNCSKRAELFYYTGITFYIALFQYWPKRCTFNSFASRIRQLPYNVQGILIPFGPCSMDYIPINYLIPHRSSKQFRLSILPKDANTLAVAGLEIMVSDLGSCTVTLDHTSSRIWSNEWFLYLWR